MKFTGKLVANPGIIRELKSLFCYYAENYKYSPKFKNKLWNGKIYLITKNNHVYLSYKDRIKEFCKENDYHFVYENNSSSSTLEKEIEELDKIFLKRILSVIKEHSKLNPYEYQIKAVYNALLNKRQLLLSPTSSGKSLIIYLIIKYLLSLSNYKILVITPSTMLVQQLYEDFLSYTTKTDDKGLYHKIYSCQEKDSSKPVYISTWQSLYNIDSNYFEKFDVVIVDEAHMVKSNSVKSILEKCINAKFRIGTTGTLAETSEMEWLVEGLLGKTYEVVSMKQLMENKVVSELLINVVPINFYSKEEVETVNYKVEKKIIQENVKRNKMIIDLASKNKENNTLILIKEIDNHQKILFNMMKNNVDKNVILVDGKDDLDCKENIKIRCETSSGNIIIATYSLFSQGISIKNLQEIIFANYYKAKIKVLQSIGRGLRLDGKTNKVIVYDLVDNLHYAMKHFSIRKEYYKKQNYKVKIYE